jgi:SOS response regulatory protein OraA/RecX
MIFTNFFVVRRMLKSDIFDMPVIKSISKKGRYVRLVFEDEEYIQLTREIYSKNKMRPGSNIPDHKLKSLKTESDRQRAISYIDYLLTARPYSTGLLNYKLEQKGYSPDIVKPLLLDYMNRGLLNDRAFANQMAESILRNRPAGRRYIIARLQQKHIPFKLAGEVVDELFSDINETDLALRMLRKRWSYFSKFELETARRKAYNYLARRTIGYSAAQQAFNKIVTEDKED